MNGESAADIQVKEVTNDELYRITKHVRATEGKGFPADEADSYDKFVYRHNEAPDLLIGGYLHGDLVGFICATRYAGKQMTDESMEVHIPNGESVCIHSVVVQKEQRRKGIALQMLHKFVEKVKTEKADVARIRLICKSYLIPLYTRAGFELIGKSVVVHGKDPWYEFEISLRGS